MKIKMTIEQLLFLLNEQKIETSKTICDLIKQKHAEGEINTETLYDEIREKELGSSYPADVQVLIKYGRK